MTYSDGKTTDTGIAYMEVNGERIDVSGSFTYKLSGKRRTPIDSTDRLVGHSVVWQSGYIACDAHDNADLDVEALQQIKDATITLQLYSGKVIVAHNAAYVDEGVVAGNEGKIPLKWASGRVEEVK